MLIVTAFRMVDYGSARKILRGRRSEAAVFVLTAAITIAFDLILAVEIGIAVAAIMATLGLSGGLQIVLQARRELTSEEVKSASADPATLVAAPGTSCRHQIHDFTGETATHPAVLLRSLLTDRTPA